MAKVDILTIGRSSAKCREEKNLSRQELAKKAGVAYQSLYYWENDWATPRVDLLMCIADTLDVTLDELVGRRVRA